MSAAPADSMMAFCQAPHQFLLETALTGPDARFRMNDETFLVLSDPMAIHVVMNNKQDDFEKGAMIEIPRGIWREGIITVEAAGWAEQHAMISPQFARRRIRDLEPLIARLVYRQIERWAALPAGEPIDLLLATNRFAFDVVMIGLLDAEDSSLADQLFDALGDLDRFESIRIHYLAKRFRGDMPIGFGGSAYEAAVDRLGDLCGQVADERLARAEQPDDLLGAVMATPVFQAYAPERQRAFLVDQVATMLAAGYVTTGESIFWSLYLLALNPEAQQRARAEVLEHTGAGRGEAPVDATPFLAAALDEAHRLYPPVWFMGRVAVRDTKVGEIDVPAGTRVVCSPYVLHRMPTLWPDADQYRPERFLPEAETPVTPRALIPYGTGRRACMGRGLAQMEMAAIAAMTLARFEIEPVSNAPVVLAGAFSMHPRKPLMVRLRALA